MTNDSFRGRIAYPELPNPVDVGDLTRLFAPTTVGMDWASNATSTERMRHRLLTLLNVFQMLGRFISPTIIPVRTVLH